MHAGAQEWNVAYKSRAYLRVVQCAHESVSFPTLSSMHEMPHNNLSTSSLELGPHLRLSYTKFVVPKGTVHLFAKLANQILRPHYFLHFGWWPVFYFYNNFLMLNLYNVECKKSPSYGYKNSMDTKLFYSFTCRSFYKGQRHIGLSVETLNKASLLSWCKYT